MTKRDLTETEIDALFEAQRAQVPPPSDAFMARIAADAAQAAARAADQAGRARAAPHRHGAHLWHRLGAWISGVAAPGGAVVAGCLGLWIGAVNPQFLPDPALLWQDAGQAQLSVLDDWYGVQDLDTVEWDDG